MFAHPARFVCTNSPLSADGKPNAVQFRLKCNYPIHELSFRIGPDSGEVVDEPEDATIVRLSEARSDCGRRAIGTQNSVRSSNRRVLQSAPVSG